jgi:hypothetical protein
VYLLLYHILFEIGIAENTAILSFRLMAPLLPENAFACQREEKFAQARRREITRFSSRRRPRPCMKERHETEKNSCFKAVLYIFRILTLIRQSRRLLQK